MRRTSALRDGELCNDGWIGDNAWQGLAILNNQARGESRDLRLVGDYSMPDISDSATNHP